MSLDEPSERSNTCETPSSLAMCTSPRRLPMPARHGIQVLQRLQEHPHEIWHQGERVQDVTTHPAFTHGLHSLAALYDLQWERPAEMLYASPTTGEPVGLG